LYSGEEVSQQHHDITEVFSHLFETTNEKITAAVSGAAIISPAFNLKDTSETAALFLPILGCLWLLFQIGLKTWEILKK
jgi:hypothetical protein